MTEEKRWKTLNLSEEDIRKQLDEREGGRKAGRGDSPYTQDFHEETYGLKEKKEKKE